MFLNKHRQEINLSCHPISIKYSLTKLEESCNIIKVYNTKLTCAALFINAKCI